MGDLGPLATGHIRPEYQSDTDRFTNVRRYYDVVSEVGDRTPLPDNHPVVTTDVRTAIARGIGRIPKLDQGMRDPRMPGRYELAIVRHFNILSPVFVDAQPSSKYSHPYALPEEPLY